MTVAPQCLTILSATIADSSPEKAEDIQRAFDRLDDGFRTAVTDPTRTKRDSLMVKHKDGARSHFCYRRPMTLDEIKQEKNPPPPKPPRPVIYPDGIPDGYDNPTDRPRQPLWRELAQLVDCILTYRKDESNRHQPFERKHPRMCGEHSFAPGPDGDEAHYIRKVAATPDEEEWHHAHLPTMGLHREDLSAYYRAQRGPLERSIDLLMFWR